MEAPDSPTEKPLEEEAPAFTSTHTSNFPQLLRDLGISLLVSTYQAGRLIVVRADGDNLNTHFCLFRSPMGLAYDRPTGRLAIGTKYDIWQFHDQPDVAARLEPPNVNDAVFLPRWRHYTGDIRIHEIDWCEGEIWAVNTRFSCLCTFDREHSFVPRWRPPFVSALAPQDRCHLNGMAVVGGRPRYVTCLARTDTPGGWRAHKRDGGCLIDLESEEAVLTGLCMPHSPRLYARRHWLLESGIGAFSVADLQAGTVETVAKLPGFTRGLDFCGPFAFIGLSQVRESATFSGIPLVDELKERTCGVWVVDIRTGQTVAFLRFEGIVQEIFSVQVLPNIRFPDVINEPGEALSSSFVLPDDALAQVPQGLRGA